MLAVGRMFYEAYPANEFRVAVKEKNEIYRQVLSSSSHSTHLELLCYVGFRLFEILVATGHRFLYSLCMERCYLLIAMGYETLRMWRQIWIASNRLSYLKTGDKSLDRSRILIGLESLNFEVSRVLIVFEVVTQDIRYSWLESFRVEMTFRP